MFGGAYRGRSVFVTGHTGFKGAWLTQWLLDLGAAVTGYALEPTTAPSPFDAAGLDAGGQEVRGLYAPIYGTGKHLRARSSDAGRTSCSTSQHSHSSAAPTHCRI